VDKQKAQGVDVRRRLSRAEAEQLIAEYETSGLSRVEFCRQKPDALAVNQREAVRPRMAGSRL